MRTLTRLILATTAATGSVLLAAGPGRRLRRPRRRERLDRARSAPRRSPPGTTGVEHYVTSFEFSGTGESVGLDHPAARRADRRRARRRLDAPAPADRGGASRPRPPAPATPTRRRRAESGVEILLETEIDALDITVLSGGGDAVGQWAIDNGFLLTPDTPEVLDFYAERSPVFLAAKFDASRAAEQGLSSGQGTPVHITMDDARAPGCRCGSSASASSARAARAGRRLPPHRRGAAAPGRRRRPRRRAGASRPTTSCSTTSAVDTGHGLGARRRLVHPPDPRRGGRRARLRPLGQRRRPEQRARRRSTPGCSSPASTAPTRRIDPADGGGWSDAQRAAASAGERRGRGAGGGRRCCDRRAT